MSRDFCIIGSGKVGTALAYLLSGGPWEFVGAGSRSFESARRACKFVGDGIPADNAAELVSVVDLVFLTTPDDVIVEVCQTLADAGAFRAEMVVAHCSGALPSTALSDCLPEEAHAGSMHPLQTFATVDSAVDLLPGTYCCVEGDERAKEVLQQVAQTVGARSFTIPTENKSLYHAAAVMACNYLTLLQSMAVDMGEKAGMPEDMCVEAFMPLIRGTVENLEMVGLPDSLTGPVVRGDVKTVESHLEALRQKMPELLPVYNLLGQKTVALAQEQGGIDQETARIFREMFGVASET